MSDIIDDKDGVKTIVLSNRDRFYFSRKYDESIIGPLLAKAQILYLTLVDLPILPSLYSQIEEEIILRSIHSTAALEGNPLSEESVAEILSAPEKVKTNQSNKMEIKNLKVAYDYIKSMKDINKDLRPDEDLIKIVHEMISKDIEDDEYRPGLYRISRVKVGDVDHGGVNVPPVRHKDIKLLMNEFFYWINNDEILKMDTILRAAIGHYHLGLIHPFKDGNGRTIRLIEALLIQAKGFKFFPTMLSNYYYRNMDEYYWAFSLTRKHKGKEITPFLEFVLKGVIESLETIKERIMDFIRIATLKDYFLHLRGEKIITLRQHNLLHILLKFSAPFALGELLITSPFNLLYKNKTERTARRDIKYLMKMELLTKEEDGKFKINLRALS